MNWMRRGLLIGWLGVMHSAASVSQVIPPTAEPGRAEERLKPPREPEKPVAPSALTFEIQAPIPPSNADSISFVLRDLVVEGSSVYSPEVLLKSYRSVQNAQISLARVYEIAADLTARYRRDGYLLSSVVVPAQKISDGHVRLQAIEGYLASVEVRGTSSVRKDLFNAAKRALLTDRPLRNATLERYVLLLNDLPGVAAQAILQPSSAVAGATHLVIQLTSHRLSADVGANNRGSRVQGPWQYEAGIDLRSVLGLNEDTALRYLQSAQREELWLASISHQEWLTASGLVVTLNASRSRSNPSLGPSFQALNLETSSDEASAEISFPFIRSRVLNVRARTSITYHDGITGSDFGPITHDEISAVRVGVSVDTADSWRGVNLLDAAFAQGIGAFGSSRRGDPLASRINADPRFAKANLYVARLQSIGPKWSALMAVTGQESFNNVLAPEEFSFGGEFYGRAYDSAELVGDSGIAAKVELRYTRETSAGLALTAYGFYDIGSVWRRLDPSEINIPKHDSAQSVGGGLRLTLGPHLSSYIECGVPLNHIVAAENNQRARVFSGLKALL